MRDERLVIHHISGSDSEVRWSDSRCVCASPDWYVEKADELEAVGGRLRLYYHQMSKKASASRMHVLSLRQDA